MAKSTGKDFAGPAQKYAGQVKIGGGPAPIGCWYRPLTRAETDTPIGKRLNALNPEKETAAKGSIPGTPKGTAYNRQSGRGGY